MLIVKVFINETPIDAILVHNTGKHKNENDIYEVVDIEGKRIVNKLIEHKRSKGYRPLLKKVLNVLEKENIKEFACIGNSEV
jgi:hypothetical protein